MQNQVIVFEHLRLSSLNEVKDNLLREHVVLYAEAFSFPHIVFKTLHLFVGSAHFYGITTRHHTHLRMHVLQAEDILIIHPVKGAGIKIIGEFDYFF